MREAPEENTDFDIQPGELFWRVDKADDESRFSFVQVVHAWDSHFREGKTRAVKGPGNLARLVRGGRKRVEYLISDRHFPRKGALNTTIVEDAPLEELIARLSHYGMQTGNEEMLKEMYGADYHRLMGKDGALDYYVANVTAMSLRFRFGQLFRFRAGKEKALKGLRDHIAAELVRILGGPPYRRDPSRRQYENIIEDDCVFDQPLTTRAMLVHGRIRHFLSMRGIATPPRSSGTDILGSHYNVVIELTRELTEAAKELAKQYEPEN